MQVFKIVKQANISIPRSTILHSQEPLKSQSNYTHKAADDLQKTLIINTLKQTSLLKLASNIWQAFALLRLSGKMSHKISFSYFPNSPRMFVGIWRDVKVNLITRTRNFRAQRKPWLFELNLKTYSVHAFDYVCGLSGKTFLLVIYVLTVVSAVHSIVQSYPKIQNSFL